MGLSAPPIILAQFLSKIKVFWSQWNVQTMVLTSFAVQIILILVVPFRKQTSNVVIIASVWLAYLLADWVAAQAIGLISKPCGTPTRTGDEEQLYAFWAQFLLLHLGGPDTITALALEDNELWLRAGLHLGIQVYGSFGILVRSVARSRSQLWVPTLLIFVAGIIKYMERLYCLFHGRLLKYSNQDDTDSRNMLLEGIHTEDGYRPGSRDKTLTNVETVMVAFSLLSKYKGYMITGNFAHHRGPKGLTYVLMRTAEEAFGVVEVQLSAVYEALYTKAAVICTTMSWKALRLGVTLLQVGCLVIWIFFTQKQGFRGHDIRVTYVLLAGAVGADVLSFLTIRLCSYWAIAQVGQHSRIKNGFYNWLLSTRKRTWGVYWREADAPVGLRLRRALLRRWSESIPQLSLIDPAMDQKEPSNIQKVIKLLGTGGALDRHMYVRRHWFSDHLRDFLFQDLIQKRELAGGLHNIGKVKGGWTCISMVSANAGYSPISLNICSRIFLMNGAFYVILLRWHLVTELCYNDDMFRKPIINPKELEDREICKTLSDYMMYLLFHRQEMVPCDPSVTTQKLHNTITYLRETVIPEVEPGLRGNREMCCKHIRGCLNAPRSGRLIGFQIHDVMNELQELQAEFLDMWEFMAKVWGELLYYAAYQCKSDVHASSLKQGGELLSLVWMLMLQLGFGMHDSNDAFPTIQNVPADEAAPHTSLLYDHS